MPAHEFDGGQGFVAKPPRHPPHASGLGAAAAPPRTLCLCDGEGRDARGPAFRLPAAHAAAAFGWRRRPRCDPAYQDRLRVHLGARQRLFYTHATACSLARRSRHALPRATLGHAARGARLAARRTRCASPSPPPRRPAPHRLRLSTFCPSRRRREGVCRARRSAPLPTRSRSRLRRRRRASARRPNHARPAGFMFPPARPGSRGSREVSSSRRPSGAAASRPCAE